MRAIIAGLLAMSIAAAATAEHPSLFFDAKGQQSLGDRATTTHARYLQAVRTLFEWDAKAAPVLPKAPTAWDNWAIEPWTARLVNASMLYACTGDAKVGDTAVEWLKGLAGLRAQNSNCYTYGFYAMALAVGYDVLYDRLDAADREQIAAHLGEVCQSLYDSATGKAPGWWRGLYLHHDYVIPTAGLGLAALALKGQDDRWKGWHAEARSQLALTLALLGEDGAWHEGVSGWSYAMSALLPFLEATRRATGEDLFASSPWLANTALVRTYLRMPDGTYANYGDSYRNGGYGGMGSTASHSLRLLAARFGDGRAQWLADQEEAADFARFAKAKATSRPDNLPPGDSGLSLFYSAGWSLIWHDATIKPQPPDDLPHNHICKDLGYVIARSGWSAKDAVLMFRAGPVTGRTARADSVRRGATFAEQVLESVEHGQMDQNAISFFSRGNYWLEPPGYAARTSARHATLLVGGHEQAKSLAEVPLLRAQFDTDMVYLLADAAAAYPEEARVERFYRHIVWLKPDVLVVCDDVATSRPEETGWRMHPGVKKVTAQPEAARYVLHSPQAVDSLAVKFLQPDGLRLTGPTTQPTEFEATQKKLLNQLLRMAYCQAAAPAGTRTRFLTVLAPDGTQADRIEVGNGAGVFVKTPGRETVVILYDQPLAPAEPVAIPIELGRSGSLLEWVIVSLPGQCRVNMVQNEKRGSYRIEYAKTGREASTEGVVHFRDPPR